MTPYVGCTFAQAHLEACVDDELPMGDQILVEGERVHSGLTDLRLTETGHVAEGR